MSSSDNNDQQYGSSSSLLDYVLKYQLTKLKPQKIVDFGAGAGKNGRIIRDMLGDACLIVAVEGSERTSQMLREKGPYDEVHNFLLQEWSQKNTTQYDLAVFGDVLEHLTPKEIYQVLDNSIKYFDQIIIVAPLFDIFQEAAYDNPLEVHRSYITSSFFNRYKPVEKHVVTSSDYTILNILITSDNQKNKASSYLFKKMFHFCMLILQPLSLARPFVNFLKRFFLKYKYLIRN